MSRRPGIGKTWFDKYETDVFPSDYLIHKGAKVKIPRYYDNQIPEETLEQQKIKRKAQARKDQWNNTPERLKLNVSPGSASSTKIGTRPEASNVVFTPCDRSNDDR